MQWRLRFCLRRLQKPHIALIGSIKLILAHKPLAVDWQIKRARMNETMAFLIAIVVHL